MSGTINAIGDKDRARRELHWLLALMVRRAGGHAYFKWDEIDREPPPLTWWQDPDGTIHVETPMEGKR